MKVRRVSGLLVVPLALVLLAQPPLVSAQSEDGMEVGAELDASGGLKFFDLALCAVSIMAISSGVGAAFAVLTCSKAALTWWQV